MKTFDILADKTNIPITAAWNLSDLREAQDKQQRSTKQLPQLKGLQKHALIESAISSNRIEGVTIDHSRIDIVLFGKAHLQDNDEREVRGYGDALTIIHQNAEMLPVSEKTILELHRLSRANIGDAGKYKQSDSDIIEKYPDGRERVRFKPVSAQETQAFMRELVEAWTNCREGGRIHPLIAMPAMNLDFLCIHPFRDGNGRVSRLLLLLLSSHLGCEVGRYVSLDRLIEENKARYYETLDQSSQRWHEGKHDPWPYINFILFIFKSAYRELNA
jgi:Fic family protein